MARALLYHSEKVRGTNVTLWVEKKNPAKVQWGDCHLSVVRGGGAPWLVRDNVRGEEGLRMRRDEWREVGGVQCTNKRPLPPTGYPRGIRVTNKSLHKGLYERSGSVQVTKDAQQCFVKRCETDYANTFVGFCWSLV